MRWRLVATAAVLAALAYGSIVGTDDFNPFGPQLQFAFAVDLNGTIHSTYVEADTTEGNRVRVRLSPHGIGIGRAEVEGQLDRFAANPSLLGDLAIAQQRLHPDEPQFTRLFLRVEVTQLHNGVAAGTHVETICSWRVR